MSGKTPEPTGKENAETMRYRVPPRKHEGHHRGKAAAQTNAIQVIGPGSDPIAARTVTRQGGKKAGLPDGHSAHRNQSSDVDAGKRK
jgi:hypothetical protein